MGWILDPSGKQDCIFVPDKSEIPPARLELLEQIRAVMREELQSALCEEEESEKKTVFPDARVVQYSPFEPGVFAELEHQGKLYRGTLNFVKDIE